MHIFTYMMIAYVILTVIVVVCICTGYHHVPKNITMKDGKVLMPCWARDTYKIDKYRTRWTTLEMFMDNRTLPNCLHDTPERCIRNMYSIDSYGSAWGEVTLDKQTNLW